VVPPVTDSRHEIRVMTGIAARMGLKESWLYEDPLTAIGSAMKGAFENGNMRDLISGRRLRLACKPRDRYPTPSGKIEFHAGGIPEKDHSPLPTQKAGITETEPFILITSSVAKHTHTQFQEVYGSIPAVVHINTEDAGGQGLSEGDQTLLTNRYGSIRLRVVLSNALPRGVLWSPKEGADLDGNPQNSLMDSRPQTIGQGPRFNTTRVSLRKMDHLQKS
jgi:anaerobic selenocysteine-containing dehydrogenase